MTREDASLTEGTVDPRSLYMAQSPRPLGLRAVHSYILCEGTDGRALPRTICNQLLRHISQQARFLLARQRAAVTWT